MPQEDGDGGDWLDFKKVQNDRRVDSGSKWSPIFGRYGSCMGIWQAQECMRVFKLGC